MKSVLPNTSGSLLLGAALAGLASFTPSDADAIVVGIITETTDFSGDFENPTVLSFDTNMITLGGGILGQITSGSDNSDYFRISGPASTSVSIPFSVLSNNTNGSFGLSAYGISSQWISTPNAGQVYNGTLNFTMPVTGQVMLQVSQEMGTSTYNYAIGNVSPVPEASTGMLSLAAMAAAALRRRREQA